MQDIADFLRAHPPFDALTPSEIEAVAATAEIEFHATGTTIVAQGADPLAHVHVIRAGTVELVDRGRVLDLLGEGELFGYASMLSGLPAGFTVRTNEDVLCYRLPADALESVLARPSGLRFVARSLGSRNGPGGPGEVGGMEPAVHRVGSLVRGPAVTCGPETTIRDAARMMTAAGQTCVVIELPDGVGILTDRDLRSRVVADGVSTDAPVSAAMTAPAATVSADRLGADVLVEMLDRGVRHFPVVDATGAVLGVVGDSDLVAVESRTPFHLRAAIARAADVEALAAAAAQLRPTVVALHDARVAATHIGAVIAIVADAVCRRLLDLETARAGEPPVSFAWLALGSLARREAAPSSDADSALVWHGSDDDPVAREYVRRVAATVVDGLAACGFDACPNGACAAMPLFSRSLDEWRRVALGWLDDPDAEKAVILVSVLVDGRVVWGLHHGPPLAGVFAGARDRPRLLRLLARMALARRPPTGFLRDIVVEHSGEHKGLLDIKNGGLLPVVDLARYAAMAAGATSGSTRERLRAASAAGTLAGPAARTLEEALDLFTALRMDHQVEQLRAGQEPDDHLDPRVLNPLTRGYVKEAFRAVASVQRGISAEMSLQLR